MPAEQLLVFDVKEGWEPLCAFLEKPMPASPFPRVNEAHEVQEGLRHILLIDRMLVLCLAAITAYAVFKVTM